MYCKSLTKYERRISQEVNIGGVPLGGNNPIRAQSMTTVDTMDTQGSIEQCIRMIDAGCEYVRITAPSIKEAQNLENIRKGLRAAGYDTPLIADIHFTPNAAELAARIVEKVRVNPGNYADKKKFDIIEYTDEQYQAELDRIYQKFVPLVKICKEYGTAMRVGTNHGSLSDRIVNRYGDNPEGMVESALEFIRICEAENFHNIVVSMKSSNTQVMVQAYRLLVHKLQEENLRPYPLHLGVTEAGDGEDGRIKSAVGIGTLLEDGLGDTVRVSLTEAPEAEAPVAQKLIDRYTNRANHKEIPAIKDFRINPYHYEREAVKQVLNFGGDEKPKVIADLSGTEINTVSLKKVGHHYLSELDKWTAGDQAADYIYIGDQALPESFPHNVKFIGSTANKATALSFAYLPEANTDTDFVGVRVDELNESSWNQLKNLENALLVLESSNQHWMPCIRAFWNELRNKGITNPIVYRKYYEGPEEDVQINASSDVGGMFLDGAGDGIWIQHKDLKLANSVAYGILQATRTRMSKTEYISCPSCGRTLFDLEETTAMIRERTDHLKGVKIGIMGCIVNGPGEMADADYGYVGSGIGKITLYKGQEVVKKGVPSKNAVNELIEIIRADGNWVEPVGVEGNS